MYQLSLIILVGCFSALLAADETLATKKELDSKNHLESMRAECRQIEKTLDEFCSEFEKFDFSEPTALISGFVHSVPDSALTASSSWHHFTAIDHGPQCSRLRREKPASCFAYAWHKGREDANPWIQVDLGSEFFIYGVATQGRVGDWVQWVKTYKLATVDKDGHVHFYHNGVHGTPKILDGNSDQTTVVKHHLHPIIFSQLVRLYPLDFNGHPSLRWELYGYKPL